MYVYKAHNKHVIHIYLGHDTKDKIINNWQKHFSEFDEIRALTSKTWADPTSDSSAVCLLLGVLCWDPGGFTSTETETGSKMESAVSSSLDRVQEKSSRPSIEQLIDFSECFVDSNFSINVDFE